MIESNAGRNRTGAGRIRCCKRRARDVVERASLLVVERPQPVERRIDLAELEGRELHDVVARRRAVRGEVLRGRRAPRSPAHPAAARARARTATASCAATGRPAPCARTAGRAQANATVHRSSVASTRCAELEQLARSRRGPSGTAARSASMSTPSPAVRPRCDSMYAETIDGKLAARSSRAASCAATPALTTEPVDQRRRQLLLAETLEPRPERDVRRGRVLRLQRDEPSRPPRATGIRLRPTSSWRASSVRFSSRRVSVLTARRRPSAGRAAGRRTAPAARRAARGA